MRCVIIDDELPAIQVLETYIQQIPGLTIVGTSTNPILGIELIKKQKADVAFLDIQMDEMNGIDVSHVIGSEVKIVFCTAYSEFAVESYELNAVDYLMKPIAFNRFVRAVQRVYNSVYPASKQVELTAIADDYIFVQSGQKGKYVKIDLDEIQYIESDNNYVVFHQITGKTLVYLSLKELEERLPQSQFIRVHRSYIVPIKQILSLQNNELLLRGCKTPIPLGGHYKEIFYEKMSGKLM